VRRIAIVPIEGGNAAARTGEAGRAVEAELAQPLSPVGASTDAARMDIGNCETSADHGLRIDLKGGADARAQIQVVSPHGRGAVAAIRPTTGKLERAQMVLSRGI